jgi:hypothetical protein
VEKIKVKSDKLTNKKSSGGTSKKGKFLMPFSSFNSVI